MRQSSTTTTLTRAPSARRTTWPGPASNPSTSATEGGNASAEKKLSWPDMPGTVRRLVRTAECYDPLTL
jgi:hypothetical protein